LQEAAAVKRQATHKKLQRRHSAKLKAGRAAAAAAAATRRQQAAVRLGAQAAAPSSPQPVASSAPLKVPAVPRGSPSSAAVGKASTSAVSKQRRSTRTSKWLSAPPAVRKATLAAETATAKTRATQALDQAKTRVANKAAARKAAQKTRRQEQSQVVAAAKQQRQAGRTGHTAHSWPGRRHHHSKAHPSPPAYDDSSVLWLPCSPCPPGNEHGLHICLHVVICDLHGKYRQRKEAVGSWPTCPVSVQPDLTITASTCSRFCCSLFILAGSPSMNCPLPAADAASTRQHVQCQLMVLLA
jgi:hypothetical protein